jgi:kynurenine formamidase
MKLQAEIGGKMYAVSPDGIDLSIPLLFNGEQPNTYGVAKATAKAYESGGWVGDTRRGGSCNFETYTLTPHCNGTHTECVGHIANARISISEILRPGLQPATLITVTPQPADQSADTYDPALDPKDLVIDQDMLHHALKGTDSDFHTCIVIRTLPNAADKKSRDYMEHPPAFFTEQAMEYLAGLEISHLLIDLPSVDRLFDDGKLSTHHQFWEVPRESHQIDEENPSLRTITEMIFVPDEVADGSYLLDLQIAPFMADAAPSRPVLFALEG